MLSYFITIVFIFAFFLFIHKAFPDSSVDVVLAAHCFHWFANEEAVKEIYRVLTPQGTLGMIWALPDESVPWLKETMTFFHPLEEDFKYTISKETMDKVFEEVGKLFTIEKESGKRLLGILVMMAVTSTLYQKESYREAQMKSNVSLILGLIIL